MLDVSWYSEIAEQLQMHLKETPMGKFYLRVNCVFLAITGGKKGDICRNYGICRDTLNLWINGVLDGGVEALRAGKQTGRPRKLTEEQRSKIDKAIGQSPSAFGYEQTIWEGKLLVDYIEREFEVTVSVRTAQLLIKQLGYTLQRPRISPAGSDEEQRSAFSKL